MGIFNKVRDKWGHWNRVIESLKKVNRVLDQKYVKNPNNRSDQEDLRPITTFNLRAAYLATLATKLVNIKPTEQQFAVGVFLQQIYSETHRDIAGRILEVCESHLRERHTQEVAKSNKLEKKERHDEVTEERIVISFPEGSCLRVSSCIVRNNEVLLRLYRQEGNVIWWYTDCDLPFSKRRLHCTNLTMNLALIPHSALKTYSESSFEHWPTCAVNKLYSDVKSLSKVFVPINASIPARSVNEL
jgi:hypothetical protein